MATRTIWLAAICNAATQDSFGVEKSQLSIPIQSKRNSFASLGSNSAIAPAMAMSVPCVIVPVGRIITILRRTLDLKFIIAGDCFSRLSKESSTLLPIALL